MTNPPDRSGGSAAAIIGMGACSPIGHGVRPIQAAMAGGLRNFQEGAFTGDHGEPVRTSRLTDIDEMRPRAERLSFLTRGAVADLLRHSALSPPARIPIFIAAAAGARESELEAIRLAVVEGSNGLLKGDIAHSRTFRDGRIAFLSAMAGAIRSFDDDAAELALVVAADTRCTWDVIEALLRDRRLLTSRDDGTIPGEAAVVALVASTRSAAATEHTRFRFSEPAFASDEFEAIRTAPQATNGLSRAFQSVREQTAHWGGRPQAVMAFESGELFFTRAFATGYLRNVELMPEPLYHELVASNVGDTGAAAAGLALVRSEWLMHRASVPAQRGVLIYGHADDGRCAAALVTI
jgi:hypothetical protein